MSVATVAVPLSLFFFLFGRPTQVLPSTWWDERRFRTTLTEETAYFRTTKFGRWSRQWRCSSCLDQGVEKTTAMPSCPTRLQYCCARSSVFWWSTSDFVDKIIGLGFVNTYYFIKCYYFVCYPTM